MQTFEQMHDHCRRNGQPCCYFGKRGDWFVAAGQHRDSDSIEQSNFRSILRRLGGESDAVAVERENHWAVGWVEFILIHPSDSARLELAEHIREGLKDYPLVDEDDHSQLEWDSFWQWAQGELSEFDGWEKAIQSVLDGGNYFIGDQCSEWDAMETARRQLAA